MKKNDSQEVEREEDELDTDWLPGGFWDKLKIAYKKKDEYKEEAPFLSRILKKIVEVMGNNYSLIEPLGMGGSGIVLKIYDSILQVYRAMKFPRPTKKQRLIDSVRNEIEHLQKIRHKNVISIYFIDEIVIDVDDLDKEMPNKYPFFIMDYIEGAKTLKSSLKAHLKKLESHRNSLVDVEKLSSWITKKIFGVCKALLVLHQCDVIHFDVKPSNILIDRDGTPILNDLGFAKKKLSTAEDQDLTVVVGFSAFYAHPTLKNDNIKWTDKNRVRHELKMKDFDEKFDIYALGKSILQLLSMIDKCYSDTVAYNYIFIYLHLMACRMLDGRNLSSHQTAQLLKERGSKGLYREEWMGLAYSDFEMIKYKRNEKKHSFWT